MCLIVQAYQILACHVEPIEVIHCILCIIDVLIHHKCSPLGLSSVSPTKNALFNWNTYLLIWRMAPYLPKISNSSSAVILNGRFLTKIMRFTSGGKRIYKNSGLRIVNNKAINSLQIKIPLSLFQATLSIR